MTGEQIVKRYAALKSKRTFIEPFWKSTFDNTFPLRGARILGDNLDAIASTAETKARIYDATLRNSVRGMSAALIWGLTPANSIWAEYEADETNGEVSQADREWLEKASKTIWTNIHASGWDVAALEFAIDFICAMGVIFIEDGIEAGSNNLYQFEAWELASCCFAASKRGGIIDTCYRSYSLTAEQAVNYFTDPRYPLSEKIIKDAKNNPDNLHEFRWAIYPRTKPKSTELPIASEHVEVSTKKLIKKSGYHEQPFSVGRSALVPGSVYSEGPASDALPDHKTLNEVVKYVLQNADMAIAGMWGAVDDGVLNPKTVTVGPRKLIMMSSKDSLFPLTPGGKLDVGFVVKKDIQGSIRESMLVDQFHPDNEGPQMTAYEIARREDRIAKLLSPILGRLQSEHLPTVLKRCAGIALRAKKLGDIPDSLKGKITKISYKSPFAKAQKVADIMAIERHENGLINVSKVHPEIVDTYDWDKAQEKKSQLLGVPQGLIRDEKAVLQIRKDRATAQQAALDQQQKAEMNKAVAPEIMKSAMNNGGGMQ